MMKSKRLIAELILNDEVIMNIDDNLLSAEFEALDRGSLTDVVDWGIYANRGSLSFIDRVGYFNNSNVNSAGLKNAKVRFYLAKDTKQLIATFDVADAKFSDATKQVDIALQSHLLTWQNIKTKTTIKKFNREYPCSIKTLISEISVTLGVKLFISDDDIETLGNIFINCVFIEPTSLWDIMTQICQASMCRIFEDNEGTAIISSGFPDRTPIVVGVFNSFGFSDADYVQINNASIRSINREVFSYDYKGDENFVPLFVIPFKAYNDDGTIPDASKTVAAYVTQDNGDTYNCLISITAKPNHTKILDVSRRSPVGTKRYILTSGTIMVGHNLGVPTAPQPLSLKIQEDNNTIKLQDYLYSVRDNSPNDSTLNTTYYTDISLFIALTCFDDDGFTESSIINNENDTVTRLNSNDLIQTKNRVMSESPPFEMSHRNYILKAVIRYANGIECVKCDCLFNDYYDENGNLVLDGSQLEHFKQYDIVIPYTVKRGQRVPYRTNADGTPKQFRIIGIQYSYDGLLKQKLWLQEEQ